MLENFDYVYSQWKRLHRKLLSDNISISDRVYNMLTIELSSIHTEILVIGTHGSEYNNSNGNMLSIKSALKLIESRLDKLEKVIEKTYN